MPNNDQQNPKKVAEHTTKSINAKKKKKLERMKMQRA